MMKQKIYNRIMVVLLSLVLTVAILPTTVFAAPTYNPFYEPPTGTATPASPSGATQAVPYEFTEKKLAGTGSVLFDSAAEAFKAEFISPVAGTDYGTVTFNNNAVQYIPNDVAAGKTVKFKVYAVDANDEWTSDGITFTVKVNEQPTDASSNANLNSLSYQVGNGSFIDIPNFSSDILEYTVELPEGTEHGQTITLNGVKEDNSATIEYTTAETAWISGAQKATAVVTAENTVTKKEYTVNFYVKPADSEPKAFLSSGTVFEDGDTIFVQTNETIKLNVSLGSGNTAAGSAKVTSSDRSVLPITEEFTGLYPDTESSYHLSLEDGKEADLTISFYRGDCTQHSSSNPDDTIPYLTVVLHIVHHDHNLAKTEANPATCTEAGNDEYYTCAECGKYFFDKDGKYEIEKDSWIIPATDHSYGEPVWSWTDDYSGATATFTCGNDASHTEELTADIAVTTTEATATQDGQTVYTATVELDGNSYTDTQTVVIPATGTTTDEPDEGSGSDEETTTPDTSAGDNRTGDTTSPETGDYSNLALWLAVMLAAGAGLTGTILYSCKRKYSR